MKRTLSRLLVTLATFLVAFNLAAALLGKDAMAPGLGYAAVAGGMAALLVEIWLGLHDIRVMIRRRRVEGACLLGLVLVLTCTVHGGHLRQEIEHLRPGHAESA